MAEYRSRRERRHAKGGNISGEKPEGIAILLGVKSKKKKEGGCVEGGMAKAHLGKRARGGATPKRADGGRAKSIWTDAAREAWEKEHADFARQKSKEMYENEASPGNRDERARGGATGEPRLTKQLDAREAALSSDGVDKGAKGSGREEREVPEQKRDADDPADDKVDSFYLKTVSGKTDPKQMYLARPSKFGADEDYRRARGGSTMKRESGGHTDQLKGDFTDRLWKNRPLTEDIDPKMRKRVPHASTDERGEHVFTPDLYQGKDKYDEDDSLSGAKRGGRTTKRAEGGSVQKAKYEVDDSSSRDMGDLTPKKSGPASKYETEEPQKRARGGWISSAREPPKHLVEAMKSAGPALRKKIQFSENVRK